jgi:hypothetical protein
MQPYVFGLSQGIKHNKPKTYGCINYSSAPDYGLSEVRNMLSELQKTFQEH